MPQSTDDRSTFTPVRLLKGAALTFFLLGITMAVWGIDKWIRYPNAQASQFGFEAPLWPAFVGCTVLGAAVGVFVLWTAARRVEAGEDVFSEGHKQHSLRGEQTRSEPGHDPPHPTHRS